MKHLLVFTNQNHLENEEMLLKIQNETLVQ